MLLSVIPGPRSTACDLGVPFCEEGGEMGADPCPWPRAASFTFPAACQPCTFAEVSLCLLSKGGDRAGAVGAEQTPWPPCPPPAPIIPTCLLPSNVSHPEQTSHGFGQKSRQNLMSLRAAPTCQGRCQREKESDGEQGSLSAVPVGLLCGSAPAQGCTDGWKLTQIHLPATDLSLWALSVSSFAFAQALSVTPWLGATTGHIFPGSGYCQIRVRENRSAVRAQGEMVAVRVQKISPSINFAICPMNVASFIRKEWREITNKMLKSYTGASKWFWWVLVNICQLICFGQTQILKRARSVP